MAYQPKSYRKFLAGTITAAVVASAVAPAASAAEVKFTDLAGLDSETSAAIEALVGLGVIVGYQDGTFKPNQTINRGQAAEMTVKALPNVDPATPTGTVFEDLTAKSYYAPFAEALANAGLIAKGGKFAAGTAMTREAMAVALVAGFGLKDNGTAVEIKDLDKVSADARAAVKILAQHGLTKLVDGNFNPTDAVKRSQFALFFYRAVAATVATAEVAEIKSVNETTLEVKVKGSLTKVAPTDFTFDGGLTVTAAEIVPAAAADTFTTVKLTTSKQEAGKTYKLVTFKGAEVKTEVKVVVPAATASFESVTTNNLKSLTLKFSKAVTAAEAEKAGNYTVKVGAATKEVEEAKVQADGVTVVLTLKAGSELGQQNTVDVTVNKLVGLAAAETKSVSVLDTTIPVAEGITLTGPNTFSITFSEPVQAATAGAAVGVSVNNGVYGVDGSKTKLSTDGKTLNVTLAASTLPEGTYNIKVDSFKDFANFAGVAKTFPVEYKKDVTVPTAELVSASQTEVKIKFSKPVFANGVALTKDYFYHTYSAWKPVSVESTDAQTYVLKFKDEDTNTQDYYLPVGSSTVTVLAKVGDHAAKDAWGNVLAADAKLTATVTADTQAPEVKSVVAKAENKVELTFSEDVTLAADSITVKDSAGTVIANTKYTVNNVSAGGVYKYNLDFTAKLAGGTYTVEVKNVKDKALAPNTITAITHSFTITDLTAPEAPTAVVVDDSATNTFVYLTFNEDMATTGAGSVLEVKNYRLGGAVLPTGSKVELFGSSKKVKITLPKVAADKTLVSAGETGKTLVTFTIGQLADANGNAMEDFSTLVTVAADTAPTTFEASAIAKNKLQLVIPQEITTVTADGIKVSKSGGAAVEVAAIDSVAYNATTGKTTVTVTVKAEVALADSSQAEADKLVVSIVDGKLATVTGKKLTGVTADSTVADKMAASLVATNAIVDYNHATSTAFQIEFNEDLSSTNAAFYAHDLVVTDSTGKVLTAGIEYTTTVVGDTILVDVKAEGKFKVKSKDAVTYIKDAQGNTVNVFTTVVDVEVKLNPAAL
jgi:methionine-rich copper-binding protein CopC